MTDNAATVTDTNSRAGMYLTFGLADEEYGVEILKVREIICMMDITAVPKAPPHVKGVVNLRGKVVPVIELRTRFSMPTIESTEETCIIVVVVGTREIGVVVDRVSEVLDIAEKDIEDPPTFGTIVDTSFLIGMGKTEGHVTILLDITKVLDPNDIAGIA
ncbi:MAG: chemotaxis protein CheW [Planctomycetes bacterium]|jgi:purine-binding chemotaxis protein CheW|nr:chemotaxis protein CheW [Phycisphaerae bacterium]NBB95535.1 chemotaxis protein CheW [Planctomycetota bacterium]